MTEERYLLITDMLVALATYEAWSGRTGKMWLVERLTDGKLQDYLSELKLTNVDGMRR